MSLQSVLTHRATVMRSVEVFIQGAPTFVWSVVTVRTPVLLSRTSSTPDPTWTAGQGTSSDTEATLFTLPTADLEPGDRLTLTRPPTGQVFEVLPDPSLVLTLHAVSHREHKVRQVTS